MLELRRAKFPQVQKEIVEFIVFPFSREQTIWPFNIIVVHTAKKFAKIMIHVQSC